MSVVEEIKERLDLTDVVNRTVHLQKAGRNLKGLCPFHNEKTPSFFVFPDSQRWHCFGCDKGGDIFTFAMEYEGWDFRTALEELGRQAGIEVRPLTPTQVKAAEEGDRLQAALEAAAEYYHRLLLSAPEAGPARAYLRRRGFQRRTVEHFRLGYSLDAWDALRTHLLGQGFTVEELLKAGLLVERDGGGTYDRFRNRVMIPIRNRRGKVIAFGGRVLSAEDQPKYMNSPQTPLFDKSKVLFGLDSAARAVRELDAAIIVEGYMDVMIPWQAGYENIVAPMGTALTEVHLKQLQRLTRNFILALDPDDAGVQATLRGLETARQTLDREWEAVFDPRGLVGYEGRLNANIRVVLLPDNVDPDELILENQEAWQALLDSAQPVVRFYFEQLLRQEDPSEPRGKARIVDAMIPLLRDITRGVERESYAQEFALQLGIDARMILDRMRARDRVEAVRRQAAVAASADKIDTTTDHEEFVLRILLHFPELYERVELDLAALGLNALQDEDFSLSSRLIWEAWLEELADPMQEMQDYLPPELQEKVAEWVHNPLPDEPLAEWERTLLRSILHIRERKLDEMSAEVYDLILQATAEGEAAHKKYGATLRSIHAKKRKVELAGTRVMAVLKGEQFQPADLESVDWAY
ncbi:MAG: DNA primase [Anaerolineales bacterium]